ncbi:Lhr family ATP dependent helicase [Rhodoglobus vestalii]|uniref:Lhr family ATP dependent helicase n=1 Tax=Rhodoglobus vestalii TaxID=193384 RepID=A0A8H2K5T5_9MICO|nr:DEAD/DEAH box helicase [Rhodoglobus vestalii]TQO20368.1 Lhr family ATP dependent helicase [Rhodoglobus vestalii]
MSDVLGKFSPATREWFQGAFDAATPAQLGAWDAVSSGANALVVAPTGSGKTLAAFLWAIDQLASLPIPENPQHRTRVLYISPLKALGVDVERNLRAPLVGVTQTARRLGLGEPDITVGVRSGDTTAQDRRLLARLPPDILITMPESLYLMLTSAARETLKNVDTVIIDEVHAVAATKRGAHLALSLERLDALLAKPVQRIGLSATVRPIDEVARFLGGRSPVTIVHPPSAKTFELSVVVPVADMTIPGTVAAARGKSAAGYGGGAGAAGGAGSGAGGGSGAGDGAGAGSGGDGFDPEATPQSAASLWPHVEERIVDAILEHRSTIVFANSRRLAERLTARLNEIFDERMSNGSVDGAEAVLQSQASVDAAAYAAPQQPWKPPAQMMAQGGSTMGAAPLLARAHHGSVSKDQRAIIEDDLKTGVLRCVVATSSLELGIDMGAVDLVIQVESPPSVASGLQRIGRAGHQVGEISKGVLFPKHRTDLIHTSVAVERMLSGQIEALAVPTNPLDVLAQQTVAAIALDELDVEEWFDTVRRSAPFSSLPRSAFDATLDLLSGLYPSDEFSELRPRVVWDRVAGTISGRPGSQRLAVTSGGTIPDRGLFGVFMIGGEAGAPGRRVGELDEEMVYESRVGDVFALGTTSWRIESITHDQVLVSPAFGQPGRVPFWKGDGLGRPAELGEAIGAFTKEIATSSLEAATARAQLIGLDEHAVANLLALVAEQKAATGHVPSDTTLVVERFRDELGDWRVVLHSPYGMPVHAPWALAITARIREQLGVDGAAMAGDDGIVVRIPDTDAAPPGADLFVFDADELEQIVTEEVGGSALFAARFRECAARALLLPRRDPGKRSPLWQQRQRASQLLDVARKYPSFPIVLETVREVLQDVYDLPALTALTKRIASRGIRVMETETEVPSPFARSLLFGYMAAFVYEGDSPLAERRAAALSLDPALLAELLGRAELRELLDPGVIEQTELELQRLTPERHARNAEGLVDLLRVLGPQTVAEIEARSLVTGAALTSDLVGLAKANRVLEVTIAGERRWAGIEDAARLRDALGVPLPIGVPAAFIEPVDDPVGDLVSRYARTHGPFTLADAAAHFGLGTAVVQDTLRRLAADRRVVDGEFRPGASGTEWCSVDVLRRLRSRSLAALRQEVEPVSHATLGRFLPAWQHVSAAGDSLRGIDGLAQVIDQLAGYSAPASAWENFILSARIRDYSPAWLDELTTSGEVVWAGQGALAGSDGWISLHPTATAALTLPEPDRDGVSELQQSILDALGGGGAFFFRQLSNQIGSTDDKLLLKELWDLVWRSLITNDSFAPLRAHLGGAVRATRAPRPARARAYRGRVSTVAQAGPPSASGRWALLETAEGDTTVRAKSTAELMLERHAVVTRGAVVSEGIRGGFALTYRVLSGFEETGRARRGYFIEGLGAAQFATGATVDRLRSFTRDPDAAPDLRAITLAATDPANPYGAALGWPGLGGGAGSAGTSVAGDDGSTLSAGAEGSAKSSAEAPKKHRPGRKAGAIVVLVDGHLALYLERGGKSLLAFDTEPAVVDAATRSLTSTLRGTLPKLRIEKVNGDFAVGTPVGKALVEAGFVATPQGLRLRA